MNESERQQFLHSLATIMDLSPDVRFGQLLANLGFLAEARAACSMWDIDDARLLEVMSEHQRELAARGRERLSSRGE
jgi:hypothetical protein